MKDLKDQLIEKQRELLKCKIYKNYPDTDMEEKAYIVYLCHEIESLESRLESSQEEKTPVVTNEETIKESILYQALYNPMTEESAWHTLSVHKTRKGAEMAIAFHKEEKIKTDGIDSFEAWGVNEVKVEE